MRYAVRLTAVLLVLVCPQMGFAQPSQDAWYRMGLQGTNVNCLLVDDTVRMLAGTDRGLWLRDADWIQFSGGIATNASVKAMVRLSSGDIIAAVGGGSNSDGVYRGVDILDGPPFYEFSRMEYLTGAQALAVRGEKDDTLYVGAGNGVYAAFARGGGQYSGLTPLQLPPMPFGVEDPRCAGLHVCTADSRLYAGGYDRSPEPGPGSLLGSVGDSLATVRRLNASALTQGTFFEVGPVELVVGTIDSGIHTYTPSMSSNQWAHYRSPADEPVRHMIAVPGMIWSDILYVAVASGVYSGVRGNWTEVGDIPAVPNFLASQPYGQPYAGTGDGVYRYGQPPLAATAPLTVVRAARGPNLPIYDLLGRQVVKELRALHAPALRREGSRALAAGVYALPKGLSAEVRQGAR